MTVHIARLDALLYRERGIHITKLRHPHGFEWLMFEAPMKQPAPLPAAPLSASRPTLRLAGDSGALVYRPA